MIRLPGFIDIGTEITNGSWRTVTRNAIKSGYTSLLAAPSTEEIFEEKADVIRALEEPAAEAACDYAKLAVITPENIRTIQEWADEVPAALVDFSAFQAAGSFAQMNLLSRLFNRWPEEKPICVRGTENQIGSAIFMGQVHRRKVHICSVATRSAIEMISEAKDSGLSVSCDAHPLSLLFSTGTNGVSGILRQLGTEDDRQALWQHLSEIDCFSSAGYQGPGDALNVMLPLLLSMVKSEMLTKEDVLARCCVNPSHLFGIPLDPETMIEADDSLFTGRSPIRSCVHSVRLHGQTIFSANEEEPQLPRKAERIKGFSA